MAKSWGGKRVEQRLNATRLEHWPVARAWLSEKEVGYFAAPRTLPLILGLLKQKEFTGVQDLSTVYLELFSRHTGQGVVHIENYDDHAYRAGYFSDRGGRTWQERMKMLEELGFIRSIPTGQRRFGIELLVHPTLVIGSLREAGKVDNGWWNIYRDLQRQTGEPLYEAIVQQERALVPAQTATVPA